MRYDPYAWESSGDNETTTEQVYLRHIRMELQNVTAALTSLTEAITVQTRVLAAGSEARWAQLPAGAQIAAYKAYTDTREDDQEEPDINDEPPPDYGPPGSGAVITEYD
jgi:hypothetical protein